MRRSRDVTEFLDAWLSQSSVSGQVLIPDQVKVLKSYKKRLQKMTAAQKDANGNFKSNPEAEVAQAQLIQVQRDIISSSLKTAKLSLSVVVRTSQPAITLGISNGQNANSPIAPKKS